MTKLSVRPMLQSRRIDFRRGCVELNHGSGGRAMTQLVEQLFLNAFDNPYLAQQNDAACFSVEQGRMVMSTDAHVISPLFFPGGDIGSLSVHGTINDLAMSGATPLHLSASFILEEGFSLQDLKRIVESMAEAAKQAKVNIIAGDTKVVERGKGDGVFITTTGVGVVPEGINLSGDQAKPGDNVILSGSIGDHGIAVMANRHHLQFQTALQSDTAALHELVADMVAAAPTLRCLRDPTRGGLAAVLNEWAQQSQVGFLIQEAHIPVREAVRGACELLGLDPLYVANEGKLVAICPPNATEKLLSVMRAHPLGRESVLIGSVNEDPRRFVQLKTQLGGKRIIDWLTGEQLPRIC